MCGLRRLALPAGPAMSAASGEARLVRAVPLLPSLDFDETERFYAKLGFEATARSIATMTMRRDEVDLAFWLTANRRIPQASCCALQVEDLDSLVNAMDAVPVSRGRLLRDRPPGSLVLQDCHGNELYLHGDQPG